MVHPTAPVAIGNINPIQMGVKYIFRINNFPSLGKFSPCSKREKFFPTFEKVLQITEHVTSGIL